MCQPSGPWLLIWQKCLLTSIIFNSYHIRFLISMMFYLNPLGSVNKLFSPISGAISQGYNAPKLGIAHSSGAQYSSSLGNMNSALYLLRWFTNNATSYSTCTMVYMYTGLNMQHLLVIWAGASSWRPPTISEPNQGKHHGTTKFFWCPWLPLLWRFIHSHDINFFPEIHPEVMRQWEKTLQW